MARTLTIHTTLTAVAINDPNQPAEYILCDGEDGWGWVGRVDLAGEFAGFQIVRWATMTTLRLRTWRQVAHFIKHPALLCGRFASTWTATTDEYAADVLAVESAELAARTEQAAAARAAREAQEAVDTAVWAAARRGASAVYSGSLNAQHGACRIVQACDCDECDEWPEDRRLVVATATATLHHVRLSSVALVAAGAA